MTEVGVTIGFLIGVGGKTLACEQCGVNVFVQQVEGNQMNERDNVNVRARLQCRHCGEPCDITITPYRVSEDGTRRL